MNINIKNCSQEIKDRIIEDYKNNLSIRRIEEKYGVSRVSISKYLEEIGIKTTFGNHYRLYFHNINYFDEIDTEHKAYWLGFLFADGYISNKSKNCGEDAFGICISEKDKIMLELFLADIEATNPITKSPHYGTKYDDCLRVQITSQKTVDDLQRHGCVKNKTLILEPPKEIDNKFIYDFIRGFFDGDGGFCITDNKYQISFTSTFEMCNLLKEIFGCGSIIKDKRTEKTWYFRIGGNRQVIEICNLLYKNSTIFLPRKYNIYKELLNKYDENQGIYV